MNAAFLLTPQATEDQPTRCRPCGGGDRLLPVGDLRTQTV